MHGPYRYKVSSDVFVDVFNKNLQRKHSNTVLYKIKQWKQGTAPWMKISQNSIAFSKSSSALD